MTSTKMARRMSFGITLRNNGNERRNNDDERRDADLIRNRLAQQGNDQIGENQNERNSQTHADAVADSGCDGQRRTHAQHHAERGVLVNDAVHEDFAKLLHRLHLLSPHARR